MKKMIITLITVAVIAAAGIGMYVGLDLSRENSKKQEQAKVQSEVVKGAESEETEQTMKIDVIQYDIGIDNDSTQEDVIDVMHKMVHQKVKATEKWGAIPLIPDTIEKVYDIIFNSNFDLKDDLLKIATGWKNEEFDTVVEDHNYFWGYQDGTIGEAYEIMSESEEQEFVLNNFGDEMARSLEDSN
ncbi:DUF6241 domain-containing protein [Jeotgalibacillus marinus]|uniref:DUF6241 domain-containing protein n=1 Tax=Jeotgalibacillus marinus TaxID=86667 RepID=A0ABV3Q6S3_9BACL